MPLVLHALVATIVYILMALTSIMLWALAFQAIENTHFSGLTKAIAIGALCPLLFAALVSSVAVPFIFIMGTAAAPFVNAIPTYAIVAGVSALGHFAFQAGVEAGNNTLWAPSVR
ncbi:MAG: hypothetical protein NXI01_07060 [Gammaproteobacteria bacterium]|nr:hypothetical protein [Gammaproteobacteria bacterium]